MPNWTNNTIVFESEEDCKKVWEAMCLEALDTKVLPDGNYAKFKIKRFTYDAVIPSPKTKEECNEILEKARTLIQTQVDKWRKLPSTVR